MTGTIGIDLGGTKALMLCGDMEERSDTGPDFPPEALERRLRAFASRLGAPPAGIGIAVPGLVDLAGRITACDVLPKFAAWNPREALADLGARVVVANDVKAARSLVSTKVVVSVSARVAGDGAAAPVTLDSFLPRPFFSPLPVGMPSPGGVASGGLTATGSSAPSDTPIRALSRATASS